LATLRGEQVAGIGPQQPSRPGQPAQPSAWTTYLWADDADRTAGKIEEAGGRLLMPPFEVMDQGRMAIAADPAGAVFGIWQGRKHKGSGLANESGTFVWNENLSTDPNAARDFYQRIFGYEYEPVEEPSIDYTMIKVAGRPAGGIGEQPPAIPEGVPSLWNTYFAVTDTDEAAATIQKLGGQMLVEPNDTPYGRMAVARDNAGASFSVVTMPEGAQG
jgi:predicted enzyme related to lactoylglutathione lyase